MGLPRVGSACGVLGCFAVTVGRDRPRSDPFCARAVVIASKLLLVSCGVEEGHVSSFLELVDCILSSFLVRLLVVGLESR